MVVDQDEDFEALSIKKDKQKSDVFGLWVKLKIPKEEGGRRVMDIKDQIDENKDNRKRVCSICQKPFSSGKALGGHMRIHVHQLPNNKDLKKLKVDPAITFKPREEKVIDIVKEKKKTKMSSNPYCTICGKDFPSMKSLFGHMRCHPDRNWRGINPPGSNTCSSSSSSSLSDVDPPKNDDDQTVVVDLMESLRWGWSVTARRGRKAVAAASSSELTTSEDDQIREAVNYLMMLAQGKKLSESEQAANSFCKAEVHKSSVVTDDSPDEQRASNEAIIFSDDDGGDDYGLIQNKKKRKKVKLCDLQLAKNATSRDVVMRRPHDKYRCNTCDKSFPTYQALGGHRSSCHNKFNVKCDGRATLPALDFDLNEDPPSEDEAGFEYVHNSL